MALLFRWLIYAVAIMLLTYIVPGISVKNFYSALLAALVLGLVNAVIRPLIILLTLPVNILTLGLFTLVINALMLWFVASIVKGFDVKNFVAAFLGALVLWAVGWLTNALTK
ncbi:phage holin family protein [Candidatus Falkowbacteria bacterium]|nr:phage holin family protein [Candidatus Falkowbacteria bacterium]